MNGTTSTLSIAPTGLEGICPGVGQETAGFATVCSDRIPFSKTVY